MIDSKTNRPSILAFATQGANGDDEARLRILLSRHNAEFLPFSKHSKLNSGLQVIRRVRSKSYDLIVMEGSGMAGGVAVIISHILFRTPYVFSSGDAIAPFLSAKIPLLAPFFGLYERLLCVCASGFIGWTPYLAGRAISMGVHKAVTCAGWAPDFSQIGHPLDRRNDVRQRLGIPQNAVVFGIAGALNWSSRFEYCYGLELVKAIVQSSSDVYVLIVGDGTGLSHLREFAGPLLNKRIFLPGRVPREQVNHFLAAMDIGSLPQSVDKIGSFRYTTKLSEYLSMQLPFVTTEIPMAYDLDCDGFWRLPGKSPWDPKFIQSLSSLMESIDTPSIELKRVGLAARLPEFDREKQVQRATVFLQEVYEADL